MHRIPLPLAAVLGLAFFPVSAALAQREPPPPPPQVNPGAPTQPSGREPPPLPQGLEVQARGPVHEAFAEPATPPSAPPVVSQQPPAPIEELPPEQKPAEEGVRWIPGYWQWDEDRNNHLWVSGCWRVPPPGKVWLPGRWQQASGGCQYVSGSWVEAQQSEVRVLPPPPPPKQEEAPQLAPGQTYEPGCWVYRENRYVWRPGFALTVPKAWVWVSARYTWTPAGCLFAEGHWDFPLRERGLLFAPVAFTGRVGPTTQYVPRHVVREECLLSSLFVRPACHQYYFGDYFEQRYKQRGYVPWTGYRQSGACDSLFAYYCQHAAERGWEQALEGLYAARYAGEAPRPPRTLVDQEAFVRKVTAQRTLTVNESQRVVVLSALGQYERSGHKLETLRREDVAACRQSSAALMQFAQQFQQREFQVYSDQRGEGRFVNGPVILQWGKNHPHGKAAEQLKKFGAPPGFPGLPFDDQGTPKGGKPKKHKD